MATKSKKQKASLGNIFEQAKIDISSEFSIEKKIPDIITFCYSEDYLNLKNKNITLRPFQQIMLKVFYRGTTGNEDLVLTDEEIALCKANGLDNDDMEKGNVLSKYFNGEIFRELVLAWGRRSGKDFLVGLISSYEALKLLECPGGDPYAFYGVAKSDPISILTVAASKGQAKIAFNAIKENILGCRYFKDKFIPDGIEANSIYLLTPNDKEENMKLKDRGITPRKGSIVIEVGHSNSDTLRGKQVIALILDEVAIYKRSGGASSGEQIMTALTPSLNTFLKRKKVTIEGKEQEITVYDSKIIAISSPRAKDGIFYKMFSESHLVKDRLACRLPSWICNRNLTEESLRATNQNMTEEEFLMEYGAEFSGSAGENMFPKEKLKEVFRPELKLRDSGLPGIVYFCHLDPATSSHNYALVVVHKEMFFNNSTKKNDMRIVVDHIKYWHPNPSNPVINLDEVDNYVIDLSRRFYFGLITFDQWNSQRSIEKLSKFGLPAKCTRFTRRYMMVIYDELYNLVTNDRIRIPFHGILKSEMTNLQKKYTGGTGFKVYPKSDAEIATDDIVDALAGACYSAITAEKSMLTSGRLVSLPQSFNNPLAPGGRRMWQGMSGPMGYGTGAEITRHLNRENKMLKGFPM